MNRASMLRAAHKTLSMNQTASLSSKGRRVAGGAWAVSDKWKLLRMVAASHRKNQLEGSSQAA